MVPVYIVSREKEKARASCVCVHQKFLGVPISRRRSSLLRDNSHDYGAEKRAADVRAIFPCDLPFAQLC